MAKAAQGFRRRVEEKAKEVAPIHFYLESFTEDDEGNEVVLRRDDFEATRPSDDQLLLLFAVGGREESTVGDQISVVLDGLKASLPSAQYRTLYRRLKDPNDDGVTMDVLEEVFEWLMEQWQDFPTQPSSGSSGSQASSGERSTGRAPGKGSTRSS